MPPWSDALESDQIEGELDGKLGKLYKRTTEYASLRKVGIRFYRGGRMSSSSPFQVIIVT